MMRADLGMASAGASFGAMKATGRNFLIHIDQGLIDMINKSEVPTPLSDQDADHLTKDYLGVNTLRRFQKIMAPDEALKKYLKQFKN